MKEEQKIDKKFGLTSLALNNGTTVLVLTALIIIMGITTYVSLPLRKLEGSRPTAMTWPDRYRSCTVSSLTAEP